MTELEEYREALKRRANPADVDNFERLVREDERRLTVEACARTQCEWCSLGLPAYPLSEVQTANGHPLWHQSESDHNLYHECKAAQIRALLPQVRAEEKP